MGFFWLGVGQAVPDDIVSVILVEICQAQPDLRGKLSGIA
jgi:hypothetical protein